MERRQIKSINIVVVSTSRSTPVTVSGHRATYKPARQQMKLPNATYILSTPSKTVFISSAPFLGFLYELHWSVYTNALKVAFQPSWDCP